MDSKWPCYLVLFGLSVGLPACRLAEREMSETNAAWLHNCHTNIADKSERSAHALAWSDPAFIRETEERSGNRLPAVPRLAAVAGTAARRTGRTSRPRPAFRRRMPHRAISWARPTRDRTASRLGPHPVVQDTVRLPCSDFCGICHEMEAEEHATLYLVGVVREPDTCAQCHMPTYRERLTQGHLLSYIHPKRTVHNHAFPVWSPVVSAGAVEIGRPAATAAEGQPIEVSFTLTNRGAGHRIPTGEFGYRETAGRRRTAGPDGRTIGQAEQAVLPGQDLSLAPGRGDRLHPAGCRHGERTAASAFACWSNA